MGNLFSSNPNKYRYINVYDDLTLKSILHNMNEPMLLFNTSIYPYKNKIKEKSSPYETTFPLEVSLPFETISIHSLFPTVLPDLSTTSDDKSNDKNENKINIPITKINNEEEQTQKDNCLKKEISDIADKIYNSDKEKSLEDSLSLNKIQSIHDTSTEEEKELSQTNKSNSSSQTLYPGDDLINSISKTVEQQGGKCKKRYRKRYQKGGSYNVCGKINKQKYDEKPVDLSKY